MGAFLIGAYFLLSLVQRTQQIYQLKVEEAQLQREVATLQQRYTVMVKERDGLLQDTDIEKVAREDLNLVKPGETAVVVIPSQEAVARAALMPQTPSAIESPDAPALPPWARLWLWFSGQ